MSRSLAGRRGQLPEHLRNLWRQMQWHRPWNLLVANGAGGHLTPPKSKVHFGGMLREMGAGHGVSRHLSGQAVEEGATPGVELGAFGHVNAVLRQLDTDLVSFVPREAFHHVDDPRVRMRFH